MARTKWVMVVLITVAILLILSGCRSALPGGEQEVVDYEREQKTDEQEPEGEQVEEEPPPPPAPMTVSFGPLPPIEVPPDIAQQVRQMLMGLSFQGEGACKGTGLCIDITYPYANRTATAHICDARIIIDGQFRGTPENTWYVTTALEPVLFSPYQIAQLLRLSPEIRLVAVDFPDYTTTVIGDEAERLAQAMEAAVWKAGQMAFGSAYPWYSVEFTVNGSPAFMRWCPEGIRINIGEIQPPRNFYVDTDDQLWTVVGELLPVPDPKALPGPARLMGAQAVRAVRGEMDFIQEADYRAAALVRVLVLVEESDGKPGDDEEPIILTFYCPWGEETVELYTDGFMLDGKYYYEPGLAFTVMTTMTAG